MPKGPKSKRFYSETKRSKVFVNYLHQISVHLCCPLNGLLSNLEPKLFRKGVLEFRERGEAVVELRHLPVHPQTHVRHRLPIRKLF